MTKKTTTQGTFHMMKFKIGETIVEPTIGICTVEGMRRMTVDGMEMNVYILKAQSAKVYVPADQIEKRGIRRPMARDEVKKALASLKQPVSPNRGDARLQYVNYREIMKSGDPMKITRLLRDLYILDQLDELKGKEKEIMEQAKKFLCDEISFIRQASKTQVMEAINEALRQMFKKKQAKDKERAKKSGVGLSMGILGYEEDEAEEEVEEDEGDELVIKAADADDEEDPLVAAPLADDDEEPFEEEDEEDM